MFISAKKMFASFVAKFSDSLLTAHRKLQRVEINILHFIPSSGRILCP